MNEQIQVQQTDDVQRLQARIAELEQQLAQAHEVLRQIRENTQAGERGQLLAKRYLEGTMGVSSLRLPELEAALLEKQASLNEVLLNSPMPPDGTERYGKLLTYEQWSNWIHAVLAKGGA
jgi:hypothetical protein